VFRSKAAIRASAAPSQASAAAAAKSIPPQNSDPRMVDLLAESSPV